MEKKKGKISASRLASPRRKGIVVNISETRYDVIKSVCRQLKWKVSYIDDDKWDLLWSDNAIPSSLYSRMKPFQKVNHFPGMSVLSRKNNLARNLAKLHKIFPKEYNFTPRTWLFPFEKQSLLQYATRRRNAMFIVKPESSCQGKGIFLTNKITEMDLSQKVVVQVYISKPYLIDNLKFDLRIYVLLTGWDPLRIFIHSEGITRFATTPYERPNQENTDDMFMHLTNYAVNKLSPNFDNETGGHKRTLKFTFDYLEQQGHDVKQLKRKIKSLIVKTFWAAQPMLAHSYRWTFAGDVRNNMWFEILGLDILLDQQLKPYLIEVNHSPSFGTDTKLDAEIKSKVIKDTMQLLNLDEKNRKQFYNEQLQTNFSQNLHQLRKRATRQERLNKVQGFITERDVYESENHGGFKKIYPAKNAEIYDEFLKESDNICKKGTRIKRSRSDGKYQSLQTSQTPTPYPHLESVTPELEMYPIFGWMNKRKNNRGKKLRPQMTDRYLLSECSSPLVHATVSPPIVNLCEQIQWTPIREPSTKKNLLQIRSAQQFTSRYIPTRSGFSQVFLETKYPKQSQFKFLKPQSLKAIVDEEVAAKLREKFKIKNKRSM